jgi:hypothetical protein
MYYTTLEDTETPKPFCEIRAYVFLKNKPTPIEIARWKKQLTSELNWLQTIFLNKSRHYKREPEKDKVEVRAIGVKGITGTKKVKMEIDGFEVEEVDIDEVIKSFDRITFGKIYRYVAFYKKDRTIVQYTDDKTIVKSKDGTENVFDGGVKRQERIYEATRKKEEEEEFKEVVFGKGT